MLHPGSTAEEPSSAHHYLRRRREHGGQLLNSHSSIGHPSTVEMMRPFQHGFSKGFALQAYACLPHPALA